MPALRPLPPRPSLEFERKEAKALLRRLRAGDPDALERARARHPRIDASDPARIQLADAQLVIAREYGFASWPRLVRYFGDVERLGFGRRPPDFPPRVYESEVQGWLAAHRDRRTIIGRALAAYVPRFYGMRVDDVFAATVTEDDVRIAIARQYGFPSWDALIEHASAAAARRRRPEGWDVDPIDRAHQALAVADLGALQRVVESHPELLHPTADETRRGLNLLMMALFGEQRQGAAMRPIVDWLVEQGFDRQHVLNLSLIGHMGMTPQEVQPLLDLGANPNWVAPNGLPVLEHALLRYMNGEAVDALAAHATPRKALWIAAGLGDVEGVRCFLDRHGKPTAAARRLRPDFDAMGGMGFAPPLPDPDDEELLVEAFVVAMLNGRTAVLEYMASRGTPVDSMIYGTPAINIAVGNGWTPVVESLVRCGANLDLRGWRPTHTAREIARGRFEQMPHDANRRRIVELCGLAPDAILAELAARATPPGIDPWLEHALTLAADDASRLGQPEVLPENLLFGLLRGGGGPPLYYFTRASRMDFDRFHADFTDRVRPPDDPEPHTERPKLPLSPVAQAVLQAATEFAVSRRRETVDGLHLLWALTRSGNGRVAELLSRYGGNEATLTAALERET